MPNAARALLFIGILALPGCELLQRQGGAPDGRDMMMIADTVPLAVEEQPAGRGEPMPVPVEPSPFETRPGARPAAMKSDLERRPKAAVEEPRPIPREPIP